jgi:hypothetical protein
MRGENLILKRAFKLLVIGAIAPSNATPLYAAEHCLSSKAFARAKGHLIHLSRINLDSLPYNFTCDFVPCFGAVEFKGLVDETGAVRNLKVTKNSWKHDAEHHASVILARLNQVRYKPPVIRGKPVCVERDWRVEFSPEGETVR